MVSNKVQLLRISKHFKEQNWFAVSLELFIVFLAVFIGLQADNWNQNRIANETAKTYYSRLIEDMRAEESTRLARITYYGQALKYGERALLTLKQPNNDLGQQFLIDVYQSTQLWNYSPQRATYDELLSIGIANAIPDSEIRSLLANLYIGLGNSKAVLQETTPLRNNIRSHMPHSVQSEIFKHCGDLIGFLENGIVVVSLPENCDLTLDPTLTSEVVTALRSYTDLERDLTRRLGELEVKLSNLDNYVQPTRDMVARLAELVN
jgi:hypothetical protein